MTIQRSLILFEESIKSKYTKQSYRWQLNQFMKFANIKSADQILLISSDKLQQLLEDYVIKLKHTINSNSIPTRFTGIKHFCIMNRIQVYWEIIYKMFPSKNKCTGTKSWTTEEIQQMLSSTKNLRTIALIHFFASTGVRIGVFDYELRFKHTKKMSNNCIGVKVYAGSIDEYWTFLTPQAVKALELYKKDRTKKGEQITTESSLFVSYNLKKELNWQAVRNITERIIKKSNIKRNIDGVRFDVQINHGFRKRYNTILKLNNSINYNIAEKLMGHKNGLDGIYFVPTLDDLFLEFKKAIYDLKI